MSTEQKAGVQQLACVYSMCKSLSLSIAWTSKHTGKILEAKEQEARSRQTKLTDMEQGSETWNS